MAGSDGYGHYCPITRALDVLGERWTLLILREMIVGADRFNDIARGLPGISRSLLSTRLRKLHTAGLVARDGEHYVLTEAGRDLEDLVMGLGAWGARWLFGPPTEDELDPELLMWWAHSRIDTSRLPDRRVVIAFVLREPTFHAWLVIDEGGVSVCISDPGFTPDATVRSTVAVLSEVWLGRRPLLAAMREGDMSITGIAEVRDRLPDALLLSPMADAVRRAGQESSVS